MKENTLSRGLRRVSRLLDICKYQGHAMKARHYINIVTHQRRYTVLDGRELRDSAV